jgi:hypothetical protein
MICDSAGSGAPERRQASGGNARGAVPSAQQGPGNAARTGLPCHLIVRSQATLDVCRFTKGAQPWLAVKLVPFVCRTDARKFDRWVRGRVNLHDREAVFIS